jgi:hypothetical protein
MECFMAKVVKKHRRPAPERRAPLSSKQCEESLKNFCEPGAFAEEIHIRAQTITPLLREIMDFRPGPYWG